MAKDKLLLLTQSVNVVYCKVQSKTKVPNYKKNGDYYENPSLTHFTDKL